MTVHNPYAFPWTEGEDPGHTGMTLRDYFATRAMQAILMTRESDLNREGIEEAYIVVDLAYSMAEAMLREREARS